MSDMFPGPSLFGAKKGPRQPLVKVGQLVASRRTGHYGKVTQVTPKGDWPAWVDFHWVDTDTGQLLVCPDHARCGSRSPGTCPIHQGGCEDTECVPLTRRDVDFYLEHGMLDPSLLEQESDSP